MTSIDSIKRTPLIITGVDEIPIEEQFLVKFVDYAEPKEGNKFNLEKFDKALEKLKKVENVSINTILADLVYSAFKLSLLTTSNIEAEKKKLAAEAYPKLMQIRMTHEKGTIGHARATHMLGVICLENKNYKDALTFFKQTAEENYPRATYDIAHLYSMTRFELSKTVYEIRQGLIPGKSADELRDLTDFLEKEKPDLEKRYELYQKAAKRGIYLAAKACERIESTGSRNT